MPVLLAMAAAACTGGGTGTDAGAGSTAVETSADAATTSSTTGTTANPTTTVATTTAPTTTIAEPSPAQHWITVDGGQLVDRRTGDVFVPRGVNMLRKRGMGGDKLFQSYDPDWVDDQLRAIRALDFNTVRVFIDMCMPCTSTSAGVRDDFLDHLAHLIERVAAHGLVAMLTSNDVPDPGYSDRLPCCEPFGGYRNSLYLSPEGHEIAAEYFGDVLTGLLERGAPLEAVMAWQLANEWFVLRDVPPISLTSGVVTAADGNAYDLADDEQVADMVAGSLTAYIDGVAAAIRRHDPDGLVTIGFFAAEEPGAGRVAADHRWVMPEVALRAPGLDLVDLHAYPGLGATWPRQVAAFGLDEDVTVPVVLGEFGAFLAAHPDAASAAEALVRWQLDSCAHGFAGWLVWLWGGPDDDEVFAADADEAAIARALSPMERPDPCDPGGYRSSNLALGRPATASAAESDEYGAGNVSDGSVGTWWSAGAGPPQWVEIDLGEPRTVVAIRVVGGPVAAGGEHVYRVVVGGPTLGDGTAVGELRGSVGSGADLTLVLDPPVDDVTSVRVEAVSVDGWVIVHEIEVAGA